MDFALQPASDAGRLLVSRCEQQEPDCFARAAEQDREGRFPTETMAVLIASGVTAAPVPAELGGPGVAAVRDLVAGANRLGRGDGSAALAVNMHWFSIWGMARTWRAARRDGDGMREAVLATALRAVASGERMYAALLTENGASLAEPRTEAVRDGDRWSLNGRKAFATGSPMATHFNVRFRYKGAEDAWRIGSATIASDTPGITVAGNWDALGMRGSGSHDVVFENCAIPDGAIIDNGAWGELAPRSLFLSSNFALGLTAVFLGLAETARAIALRQITARDRGDRPAIQHLVGEMQIDLAAARAMLERGATIMDTLLEAHPVTLPDEAVRLVTAEAQSAKQFVTRKAIEIVDRAMTLSGGSGFMSANPLSRLYRDVRAGPFMQPFSPIEAFEVIGKIALGRPI